MTRRLLLAVLAAALVGGPLLEPALARRPKAKMTARIDGKKFKGLKIATALLYASSSFSVNTQTKPKKGVSRALTVNCGPGVDLRALPLPSPPLSCLGVYQVTSLKGGVQQTYLAMDAIELVVESIVAPRVTGSFRGAIPHSTDPAVPPASVEDGRFTAFINDVGV